MLTTFCYPEPPISVASNQSIDERVPRCVAHANQDSRLTSR